MSTDQTATMSDTNNDTNVKPEGKLRINNIYSWKNGDIISRLVYIDETKTKQNAERVTPRIIAINYVRNSVTGATLYGASIYRKDPEDRIIPKNKIHKMLRETAHKRLITRPVTGLNFADAESLPTNLRKALYKHSVAGKAKMKEKKEKKEKTTSSDTSSEGTSGADTPKVGPSDSTDTHSEDTNMSFMSSISYFIEALSK